MRLVKQMSVRQLKPNIQETAESCCDHGGAGTDRLRPSGPAELRENGGGLPTRRHFLGAMGKTLGWQASALLFAAV